MRSWGLSDGAPSGWKVSPWPQDWIWILRGHLHWHQRDSASTRIWSSHHSDSSHWRIWSIYIYMWYIMIIINELRLLQISSWSLEIFWYLLISLHHFCFFREQNRGADQWGGGHQTRVHQVQAPSAALCHWDWKDIKDSWRCWGQGTQIISN